MITLAPGYTAISTTSSGNKVEIFIFLSLLLGLSP